MGAPAAAIVPYTLTFVLLLVAPGPDFALVVRNAARGGRPVAMATAAGIASGLAVHAAVVALGLGAVIAASATAYLVIKLVGATYLVALGVVSLVGAVRRRSRGAATEPAEPAEPAADHAGHAAAPAADMPRPGLLRAYRQGVLCNVLNPKAVLTYLALMPQFLPAHPSVWSTLELSAVNVVTAVVWFSLVGLAVAAVGGVLRRERVRRLLDAVTGSVLIAFGARLAAVR